MVRPCFLVVDQEHANSISTRKLVIETAKLNVITAYDGAEAILTLEKFPRVDGVVLDAGIRDIACDDLVVRLKGIRADLPIIVVGRPGAAHCPSADHFLESFDPRRLLDLLEKLTPHRAERIKQHDADLAVADQA